MLDLYGGHAVAALGYGHPRLSDAIARAARELVFPDQRVAARSARRGGRRGSRNSRRAGRRAVFFVNSGAEANENALRVASRSRAARKIVAIEQSFHGRTAAAGAVTWGAEQVVRIPARAVRRAVHAARGHRGAASCRDSIDTAAVIVEPVQGLAGAFDLHDGVPAALRALRATARARC